MMNPSISNPIGLNAENYTVRYNNIVEQKVANNNIPKDNSFNYSGVNALSNQNKQFVIPQKQVKLEPALPTVLQPEAIKVIKGERVKSHTGDLAAIVSKDDKYTTVYKMDILAPNDAIRKIETFDNVTGNLIRVQENLNDIQEGKLPKIDFIEIKEYDPNTGKLDKATTYHNGKVELITKHEYGPDGYKKTSGYSEGKVFVEESYENLNSSRITKFDEKGQIISVETIDHENFTKQKICYKNGIPAKIKTEAKHPVPNETGLNPLTDPELVPSQPYILNYDPKQIQGEKSYYSNGLLETVRTEVPNGGFVIHSFDVNGNLYGIEDMSNLDNDKTMLFFPEYHSVDEKMPNNARKTTIFNKDGSKEVSIVNMNDHSEKMAVYSKDGQLTHYIDINKNGKRTMMAFDKQGNLMNIS